jgi:hypothetical protein
MLQQKRSKLHSRGLTRAAIGWSSVGTFKTRMDSFEEIRANMKVIKRYLVMVSILMSELYTQREHKLA